MWFLIALALHVFAPYDIAGAASSNVAGAGSWFLHRLLLNFSAAFVYYAFFFYGLYIANWGKRKFRPGLYPTASNMAHNLYYWCECSPCCWLLATCGVA
jgi:hypothetical protein